MSFDVNGTGQGEQRDLAATRSLAIDRASIPELENFMRHVLAEAVGKSGATALLRRDYETALNLLQRASEAVPLLMQQCQKLEFELGELRTQSAADLNAANQVTEQWHQLALALRAKIEENDQEIVGLRRRVEAAEERLNSGQQHVEAVRQQATTAIGIATLFHDKIIDAFGVGSAAHEVMDLLAKGGLEGSDPAKQAESEHPAR